MNTLSTMSVRFVRTVISPDTVATDGATDAGWAEPVTGAEATELALGLGVALPEQAATDTNNNVARIAEIRFPIPISQWRGRGGHAAVHGRT
ncbi:MAG TPA: hypothetical protein VHM48_13060 [Candidatus Limnocylindrales bacterium]|nr:hypothetical protein [Candidatus Limnocylindrales bacterium]